MGKALDNDAQEPESIRTFADLDAWVERETPELAPQPRRREMSPQAIEADKRAEAAQLDQLTIRQRLSHELDARKDEIPAILDALWEKAERGDVPAARELRGWFDQGLGKPGDASLDTGDL